MCVDLVLNSVIISVTTDTTVVKPMTNRERVMSILHCKHADRIPVIHGGGRRLSFEGSEAFDVPIGLSTVVFLTISVI